MVLPLTRFFSVPKIERRSLNRPLLNSIPIVSGTSPSFFGGRNVNYHLYWRQFRENPELLSPINTLCTDIIGERPTFVKPDGTPLGRNKRLDAQCYWQLNRGKETLKAVLLDCGVTGDGYVWKGLVDTNERIKTTERVVNRYRQFLSTKDYNKLMLKSLQDEDLKKPKSFDYVASATVTIDNTTHDIVGYTQRANGLTENFSPEQIIHFRWETINGFVEGFAPTEALQSEINLLWLVKGNMVAVMENAGSPDKIFILPKTQAGDKNHKLVEETLTKYKNVRQRHGVMVFTGEVDVQDITGSLTDLQFKDLALYITSNIAYAYNIPVTRIPYLIGSSSSSGDSGGMAEQGYWNQISERQDTVEDLMNHQLFHQLGWGIRLNRKYKQDVVRESQVFSMNADTVQKLQSIYRESKKRVTTSKINQILNIAPDDLEDIPEDELIDPLEKTGLMNRNFLDNQSVEKESDNRKRASTKRDVANASANKGLSV